MHVHRLKLAEPKFRQQPWQVFGRLRESGEIIRVKLPFMGKAWAATTYDAVNDVLKETDLFVRNPANAGRKNFIPMQWILPNSFFAVVNNMLAADGQKHRRLRMLVDRAFALRNIDTMSDQIQVVAERQLDSFSEHLVQNGRADLIEHYAQPFPLTVICELLGLPMEDRPIFKKWFEPFSSVKSIFGIFRVGSGIKKIAGYLRNQFAECRRNPRPGLVSDLVQTELEGEQLNEEELLSMVFLLLVAGHETTVHLISNMVLTLLQNPDSKRQLQMDWSIANAAIDEVLRYCSPIQLSKPRYVTRDVEFRGVSLRRGELIIALLASANYDPARFEDPTKFDIQRQKNYHMTFGSGPHVCLGMKLAKTETYHAVRTLFQRYPLLQPEFDLEQPDWNARIGVRGLNSLIVSSGN